MNLVFAAHKEPTDAGVYCIRCKRTKRMYVGSSKRLKRRLADHRRALAAGAHHSVFLQRAWNLYGMAGFDFFVMEYAPESELHLREQWWLDNTTCAFNMSRRADRPTLNTEQRMAMAAKCRLTWRDPHLRAAARARGKASGPPQLGVGARLRVAEANQRIQRERHRVYVAFGRAWCLKELAEAYGVKYTMLKDRVRAGWGVERAVLAPKRKGGL